MAALHTRCSQQGLGKPRPSQEDQHHALPPGPAWRWVLRAWPGKSTYIQSHLQSLLRNTKVAGQASSQGSVFSPMWRDWARIRSPRAQPRPAESWWEGVTQVSLERRTHWAQENQHYTGGTSHHFKYSLAPGGRQLAPFAHTPTWKFWDFLVKASRLGMFSGVIFRI